MPLRWKYLNELHGLNFGIGFGEWVLHMMPVTFLLLLVSWLLLKRLFPFKQRRIHLVIEGSLSRAVRPRLMVLTFIVAIALWRFDNATGIHAGVAALVAFAVLGLSGVITREDWDHLNWSVLWMVASGFALGASLQATGLAERIVSSIPCSPWSALVELVASGIIC